VFYTRNQGNDRHEDPCDRCIGLCGHQLCRFLLNANHDVIGLARSEHNNRIAHLNYRFIAADTTRPGPWQELLTEVDAVINLAGKSIFGRWTKEIKSEIRESRILTTRNVVHGLRKEKRRPSSAPPVSATTAAAVMRCSRKTLPQATISWLGFQSIGNGRRWPPAERDAGGPDAPGSGPGPGRRCHGPDAPGLQSFRRRPIGDGRQWFPWIHLHDLSAAMLFLIEHSGLSGPVNLCAPIRSPIEPWPRPSAGR